MQSIFGERERPNWCVGVSAVTMQHHESLPLTACMNGLAACMNGLTGCMNVLIGCTKALSACTKACMNTLRPGGQGNGSAAMARSSAVRDAKYLSHVTHI